jgi:12,18-didecarboxysiroheme deacetylase
MIGISKLYCDNIEASDVLRYHDNKSIPSKFLQFSSEKKPIVVWNVTKKCNLNCIHCYSESNKKIDCNELTTKEGKKVLDDLANYGVPVILFSGGEPLYRNDIFELMEYAKKLGMRVVISTNGTLITKEVAKKIKEVGVSYVGISIDGLGATHNEFRNSSNAFELAVRGIENCLEYNIKVGLRFTITKKNQKEIPGIFDFVAEKKIPRICFYHLVYSGKGKEIIEEDLTHKETRDIVDTIINKTRELHENNLKTEVLTVDNHADGIYLYLRMKKEQQKNADKVLELLKLNGGNNSGIRIGCISWNGEVYADQFWRDYSFGNVTKRPFSEIWDDETEALMKKLRDRKPYLKGRCMQCRWLNVCNGNFRVRASVKNNDIWDEDPACYLTNEEIGL